MKKSLIKLKIKKMNKWDHRFMDLAKQVSTWSKDRSTGVGAVIVNDKKKVLSLGFNGFPRGVNDEVEIRHARPEKNHYVVHAERNALDEAETSLVGATIYCTFFTCATCAHGIIQKGLKRVVAPEPDWDAERYADTQKAALQMYEEAGIEVIFYKEESDSKLIAFWEIGCGGGKVHGIVSKDKFQQFIDQYKTSLIKSGFDVLNYNILDKDKVVEFVAQDGGKKYICFGDYNLNDFIFKR
jgi:dCMP deaminase